MIKDWLQSLILSSRLLSKKSIFFYSVFSLDLLFNLFFFKSILLSIVLVLLWIFIWKFLMGMSWLNFVYLLLGFFELKMLGLWFNVLWLVFLSIIFLILIFRKIILDKKSNQLLSYFITTGWILMSYGLYFYLNWPFTLSFVIYLVGLLLISYFNFLMREKKIAVNYWIFILLNLEFYLILNYLSLNGLQFGSLILLLEYLILYFV